jgi:alkylation response protein AidB-like acyl-CoA dehydrogenase
MSYNTSRLNVFSPDMSVVYPKDVALADKINKLNEIVSEVAGKLAATVIERDKIGGTAKTERDLIRTSGLLKISLPEAYGGWGLDWPVILNIVRSLAKTDSSLAHLLGFHYLQLATIDLYGSADQRDELYRDTIKNNWFWGNALNSISASTTAVKQGGNYVLNGKKYFCSGAVDADMLLISAHIGDKLIVATVPANRKGITVNNDWDSFGQRQTDSGSVTITDLKIHQNEFLTSPGPGGSIRATTRTNLTQLLLTHVYLGITEGAFETAKHYTLHQSKAWFASGVDHPAQDPYILHSYGEFWVQLQAAAQLIDTAANSFQRCWQLGNTITAEQRGKCAVNIATAKAFITRAGLEICSKIFEATGARATSGSHGMDRFWRNLRTHTLHDPVDYKFKELGNWALNGELPEPGIYS